MYTVLSLLKFPGRECAISSFSEYILCAKTRFHLMKSHWSSGNVKQSWKCGSGFESFYFRRIRLRFQVPSGMSERFFCTVQRYMCDAIGMLSRLWVLLFHSCASKCFKPGSSLSTVLFTANIQRNRSQSRRRSTRPWVTWDSKPGCRAGCKHWQKRKRRHRFSPQYRIISSRHIKIYAKIWTQLQVRT